MHIALVREWFDRMHGGAERYAVNLAFALRARGHRVSVICDRWNVDDARGFNMVRVPFARWMGPFAYENFARATARAASKLRPDVTFALARCLGGEVCRVGDLLQRAWIDANWSPEDRARKLRFAWRIKRRMALEERIFRTVPYQRIIVESTLVAGHMRENFGIGPERVEVVPNPVDTSRFSVPSDEQVMEARRMLNLPRDALMALFIAMDFRRKGLGAAVRGFCRAVARAPGSMRARLRFVAVGRGDAGIALSAAREHGLTGQIRVDARSTAVENYLRAADVLLHPSKIDPGANVVPEALATGVAAIVSANTGYRDLIVPGRNGFILQRRDDADEISARLLEIFAGRQDVFFSAAVRDSSRLTSPDEYYSRLESILCQTADARAEARQHECALS